jgi:acetylornithine deacetylase
MCTLALEALLEADEDSLVGCLTFVSALEEESTGNGTLASIRAGIVADAVLLPEPTALELLVSGVGVLWVDVEVDGVAVHAGGDEVGVNAIEAALPLIAALQQLERELNEDGSDGVRYAVNIGSLTSGDWPSSLPASARLRVRIGFPREWTVDEAERLLRATLERVAAADRWLARRPPRISRSGLAAQGYAVPADAPIVSALKDAHRRAHGTVPAIVASSATTDARFYCHEAAIPAICYGPRARGIHGIDEAVELASIVAGAQTLTRFLRDWFSGGAE